MKMMDYLKEHYKWIEERVREFICIHSNIEYIQGSSECVEGGAFAWVKLSEDLKCLQIKLYSDYMIIAEEARTFLVETGSTYIETFDRSCADLQSYIKQENLLWSSDLLEVFDSAKKELDLQRGLIAQPIYI
ncbi:hypothetical protein FHR92_004327 [Fontibacillus solani]|uniref:Uncharacterized protein n=2 Tax=Fontibacillus TaxID=995014 RepID=A0A1G7NVG8_9BACL|nr:MULTISPECIES: hypothetical protein [Fontibacillus]MBA9087834.1 hypothetical protein [Fontibacillus solani]SDF77907.1 hypothetical protein SAMN04488542_1173 [Fontibacillus panacisegetis]